MSSCYLKDNSSLLDILIFVSVAIVSIGCANCYNKQWQETQAVKQKQRKQK